MDKYITEAQMQFLHLRYIFYVCNSISCFCPLGEIGL